MTKALIVYGTRYGAATSTSEEIAGILGKEGIEVRVVNAKEESVDSIAGYDLVIVGSGIQIDRWTSEPESFLKRFQKELMGKKAALFVCCGSASKAHNENGSETAERAMSKYLEEKAAKYGLQCVSLGLFGGVYNYNKVPWWAKKSLEAERPKIATTSKEVQPGVYDTRDCDAIRGWARDLAKKVLPSPG